MLRNEKSTPLPVSYNTNTDIYWSKNEQGRICVTFNGLTKHTFEVFCHNRQLHWFQRFYEDFKLYKQHKKQIPGGLITLRSASLVWKQEKNKDFQEPWLTNNLYLHCSVETELWTHEGTEQIRQQKILKTQQKINKWLEQESLTKNQHSEIQVKAEAKAPGCKKAQKQYAKNYRQSIHRWSYARLCYAIASKATQKGIAIECDRQSSQGKPEIQARDLALVAYRNRQQATG